MNTTYISSFMSSFDHVSIGQLGTWISHSIRSVDTKASVLAAVLTIFVVVLVTRISSGSISPKLGSLEETTDPIFMPPYWLPGIGHLLSMGFQSDRLFRDMR